MVNVQINTNFPHSNSIALIYVNTMPTMQFSIYALQTVKVSTMYLSGLVIVIPPKKIFFLCY